MTQGLYSIKDLEKLTGVKAHTIRIWEKRYAVVKPHRTATNIRYYNDLDLKKLLNISILQRHGLKISFLAHMTDDMIREKILNLTFQPTNHGSQIETLISAMIELDELKFEKALSAATLSLGFEDTVLQIIYPFLERIGVLWQAGSINPAQEHFVSSLIRQKMLVAIDGHAERPKADARRFILFLPENEWHELGLLFYAYLIRKSGHKIIYLGQSVPMSDLVEVSKFKPPDALITSITTPLDHDDLNKYIVRLSKTFPKQIIYTTGLQIIHSPLIFPSNVRKINNVMQFKEELVKYY
ncbi:MAG: MerR family transcriptional regulator [Bacteroidetes bacterium]|nr:MerR family transcriptional regulator [Bacteroidota bacterium]